MHSKHSYLRQDICINYMYLFTNICVAYFERNYIVCTCFVAFSCNCVLVANVLFQEVNFNEGVSESITIEVQ